MARYIETLQENNAEKARQIAEALDRLESFRTLLLSDKHTGTARDGTHNAWIATADVLRYVEEVRRALVE